MDEWLADLQRYTEEETRRDVEITSAVILGQPIQPLIEKYFEADKESLRVAISGEGQTNEPDAGTTVPASG